MAKTTTLPAAVRLRVAAIRDQQDAAGKTARWTSREGAAYTANLAVSLGLPEAAKKAFRDALTEKTWGAFCLNGSAARQLLERLPSDDVLRLDADAGAELDEYE